MVSSDICKIIGDVETNSAVSADIADRIVSALKTLMIHILTFFGVIDYMQTTCSLATVKF
jgi:hypothetical protein